MRRYVFILLGFHLIISGCALTFSPYASSYKQIGINDSVAMDTTVERLIKPYRDSLNRRMNVVLGFSERELDKAQPESLLGNFSADALLSFTKQILPNEKVDAAVINYGGLRIPALPMGPITVGRVYELMPFDNFLVVTWLPSDSIVKLCNAIAKAGGWPVSGISFRIKDTIAENIRINNEALRHGELYGIVVSDYLLNGGDNMTMLQSQRFINTGILMRDALIQYIRNAQQPITASLDKRIMR